jgi:PmbA protein
MYRSIVAVGADEVQRGSYRTGSVLLEQMAIAG